MEVYTKICISSEGQYREGNLCRVIPRLSGPSSNVLHRHRKWVTWECSMPVLTTNASPLQRQTESSHRGLLCEESTQPGKTDLQIKLVNDNFFSQNSIFFLHQFSCHFSPVSHFSLLMQKAKFSQLSSKINDLRMTLDVEGNECLGIKSPRFYNKCSSRFHKD